jgi:hypothetical protein
VDQSWFLPAIVFASTVGFRRSTGPASPWGAAGDRAVYRVPRLTLGSPPGSRFKSRAARPTLGRLADQAMILLLISAASIALHA